MKIKTAKRIRWLGTILFLAYLCLLVYLMFFFEGYGRTDAGRQYMYNLVPLQEIRRFLMHWRTLGIRAVLENLVGNIVGFVPFGFILPLIYKRKRRLWLITLLTLEFSLMIELTQLVLKVGSCDVDDVILNTLGGMLGYGLFYMCNRIRRKIDG